LRDVDQSGGPRDPRVRGATTTAKAASEFAKQPAHAWLRSRGTGIRRGIFLMNAEKDGKLMGQRRREDISEVGQQSTYHGRDSRRGLASLGADFLDEFVQHGCVPPVLGYDGDRYCRPPQHKSGHDERTGARAGRLSMRIVGWFTANRMDPIGRWQ
jgi:hypothetical protein